MKKLLFGLLLMAPFAAQAYSLDDLTAQYNALKLQYDKAMEAVNTGVQAVKDLSDNVAATAETVGKYVNPTGQQPAQQGGSAGTTQ